MAISNGIGNSNLPHQCFPLLFDLKRYAYFAVEDTCTHAGGPLSEGLLEGNEVTCPWHGAHFDVTTGEVKGPPARAQVQSFPVRVVGSDIEVEM